LFGDGVKNNIKSKLLKEFNLHTIVRLPEGVFAPYTSISTNLLFFNRDPKGTKEIWFYELELPEGQARFTKTNPIKKHHFDKVKEWWNNRVEITEDGFEKAKKYTVQEIIDKNYNIDLCGYPHEEEEILPPKELIQQYQEKRASLNADIDRILKEITSILGIDDLED
jgi:type I restriction enzyme M protein